MADSLDRQDESPDNSDKAKSSDAWTVARKWLGRLWDLSFYALAAFVLYSMFGPKRTGPEVGSAVSPMMLVDTSTGKPVQFPAELERPMLVKAFASWCGACKRSVWVEDFADVGQGDGLDFVAVSVDENIDLARSAKESWPIASRVLFDRDGTFSRNYHVKMLPTYVLIGTDGQVLRVTAGLPGPLDLRAWSQAAAH